MNILSFVANDDSTSVYSSLTDSQAGSHLPRLNTAFVGRDEELQQLEAIYDSVLNTEASDHEDSAMIILKGYSGSGKTELVTQFVNRIRKKQRLQTSAESSCCVLSGKFDSLLDAVSSESYSAILAALSSLVDHFSEPKRSDLNKFKEELSQSLGEERKILAQLSMPTFNKLILGVEQDESKEDTIPTAETFENGRNRLHHLFLTFFRTLCCKTRPVILFLDDMQWIDDASLDLLTALLKDTSQNNLIIIGSMRREQKYAHRLDSLTGLNRKIHQIRLNDLTKESVEILLSTSLRREETKSLTEVIYKKTHGNAFHVKQMLEIMKHKGAMTFDFARYQWIYDEEKVNSEIPNADNVAEMLVHELKSVPSNIRTALMYAAHMRSTFDLALLRVVLEAMGVDVKNLKETLDSAVEASLLQCMKGSQTYTFSHDRIQEAFIDSILADLDSTALTEFRLTIGRVLVEQSRSAKDQSWLFVIGVRHLNEGYASEPRSPENDLPQAELNLEAGKRSIERSALKEASEYLETALDALKRVSDSPWASHYGLMLQILQELAEVQFSLGNFALGDGMSGDILKNVFSMQDKCRTYSSLANSLGRREQHEEAFELCRDVLYQLNAFPKRFVVLKLAVSLRKVRKMIQETTNRQILQLPLMTDKDDLVRMEFLTEYGLRAFLTNRLPITLFCILLEIKLTFKCGLSPRSSQAFAAYGMIVADIFGDFNGATRMGEIAQGILQKTKGVFMESLTLFTVGAFIEAWNAPRQHVLELLQKAMSSGIRCGDFENAFRARGVKNIYAFIAGYGLPQIEESAEDVCNLCKQFEVEAIYVMVSPFHLLLECLTGKRIVDWEEIGTEPPFSVDSKDSSATYRVYLYYLYRLQVAFYFGKLELAGMFVDKLEPYYKTDTTYTGTIMRVFFSGLTSFGLLRTTGKIKYKRRSKRFLSEMEKLMKRGGKNILQKYLIMKAEFAASKAKGQNTSRQKVLYDDAIRAASRAGFTNDAALAYELAGLYFSRTANSEKDDILYYLNRAREKYVEWGAHGKSRSIMDSFNDSTLSTGGKAMFDSVDSTRRSMQSNAVSKWTFGDQDSIRYVTGSTDFMSTEPHIDAFSA